MASIIDFIREEDFPTYQELLVKAAEAKKNAPKKPRAPLSAEAKIARETAKIEKAKAALAALLAAEIAGETVEA